MRKALPYVFALLSATAITIDTASVSEVSAPLTGFNAASLTAVLLFAAFCLLFKNAKVSKTSICAAAVMGLCHIIGRTFFNRDSLYLICGSKSEALRSLIIFIGVTAILAVLIERLFAYFETATPNKKPLPFLATWGIIFVCWIPYLLCRPPLFGWDTMAQIDMFFGKWPMYNGHPVISTFFYGLFAKFGIALGSVNISMYFLSVSQSLLFSAALAYCLKRTRNLPKAVYFVFLAVFALVPVFSVFGTVAEKNSVYAVFVLLFTIFAYDALRGNPTKKQTVGLIVSAVMCILFRLNGVHVILPTLLIMMFGKSAAKKQIAVATIATVSVYIGTNYILLAVMNIPHGRAIEALSLPIQQSARYAREYSKETPQSEKNVLNKIFDYDDAFVS
ncbi:MAG: hypothetical protein J6X38_04045 [Abditibacteriota bacterium]|nr:hypothetical protein [Abditibacteriota bacterium]